MNSKILNKKHSILYVFGGERAQGAEIVIERLLCYNADKYNTHLILAPGEFAESLLTSNKPYQIQTVGSLKKLNRTFTTKSKFYLKALQNYFAISRHVYRYIKTHDIELVHGNTLVASAYLVPAILRSKIAGTPVKWVWSDHDLKFSSKLEHILAKYCYKLYDKTLLVSNALRSKYNDKSGKVQVLYNGLDPQKFKADLSARQLFRQKWSLAEEDIVVCIAGSINPDKGQLSLINVFKRIALSFPNLKLILAGSYASQFPDYKVQVEHAITESTNIIFVGFTSDTVQLFNGCDIVVNNSNNSRSESLGTTIYEAMACEKIVIAADTGGTPEIIADRAEGFLFKPESEFDLEEKLKFAINRINVLDEVRIAAREKVLRRFNIATMAGEYNDLLSTLL